MARTTAELPKVCIIGAGCSGITAAKALYEHGFDFDCYEKSDRVGGNWVFGNKNGMSSAYRRLFINTSRERMQYSDFPMPKHYPTFPHHSQVAEYFDAYVDHFGFRSRIQFETGVRRAEQVSDGTWVITLDDGRTSRYDALIVANGHHWNPRYPEPPFPGEFQGLTLHSHHYIDNDIFRDKNVVILGMGNSAMDIACESSEVAKQTFLAARRGAYIIPKYIFGKPLDQIVTTAKIPWSVRQRMFEWTLRLTVGRMEDYGLPKPDHRFGEAHPTISGRILDRITHGVITPKPNIAELLGSQVRFTDGSIEDVDVIVYCTGYKVTFPFFDEDFISAPDNDLPLFRRVFKPDIPNVFFIGLLQPLGAIMPLAEAQGQWVASYLKGEYALPSRADMEADMERERARMFARYVKSKRHTMQVDFDDYLADLDKERRRGEARARKRGQALPIPRQVP
ncbi:MAG: NAD(P)-binding domain-containing protein [Chloracidobacterium sp.]|uniref:Flavin-containing monooxygenase 5 n=1 Tax=Chloracidobacterium validum TaxID=2821543 RepID=A0ABX8B883_9BACT|nr:NAD(P)-binding domain-containing protein [Chloracidobacterium validum]QUW03142.1 NAD(P)-binding domain-containing protein [Chloracidobacterium validum]